MNDKIKILFVCHGNICRSPMAEFILKDMVRRAGREEDFFIASAAAHTDDIGHDLHRGAQMQLRREGIPFTHRAAVLLQMSDYEKYDCLIGMDSANIYDMRRLFGGDPDGKIYRLSDFACLGRDIADPWFTGNFAQTYRDITAGCRGVLKKVGKSSEAPSTAHTASSGGH